MGRTIEEIDGNNLSDEQIVLYNEFNNKMRAERQPDDPPEPLEVTQGFLRNIPSFVQARGFVVPDDRGSWLAGATCLGFTTGENPHLMQVDLTVLKEQRQQGLGKALLAKVVELADRWERTLIVGGTNERIPAGAAFAERVGAEPGLNAHTNRLVLAEVDREMVKRWIADGPVRAPGYELVGFDGRCPDDLVDDVADVLNVMNDAPRDDLQIDDQKMTAERFRAGEALGQGRGDEPWWLFAREVESGRLVGLTDVSWNPEQPETVFQGSTGVRPEHRGHALGKWLKAAMLERILSERPTAVDIRTGNADSNDAMLGINRELGFRPYIASTTWQLTVDRAKEYLAG